MCDHSSLSKLKKDLVNVAGGGVGVGVGGHTGTGSILMQPALKTDLLGTIGRPCY